MMKRRTYSRRRKETNIVRGNKKTIQSPLTPTTTPNKVVQKYKKKDVLFQQAVEKDIEEAIFVHDEEQKEKKRRRDGARNQRTNWWRSFRGCCGYRKGP